MSRGNKKVGFVSAAGIIFEIIKKISDAIMSLGGTDEDLHRLLTDSTLVNQIAELIMSGKKVAAYTYMVVVNYSKSLTEMIALGKYGWINDNINDRHFPIQSVDQQADKLVLVHLNKVATNNQVLVHLDGLGLKPASIEHLLAFGAAYPEIQKEFPIVALGSIWVDDDGIGRFPALSRYHYERWLDLYCGDVDGRWTDDCRFLALRK